MKTIPGLPRSLTIALAGMLVCVAAAQAANEAQTRYRQELAVCNSGQSNQDAATWKRAMHWPRRDATA